MLIRLLFFSLCSMVWSNQSLASSDIEMLEKWNELSLQSIRNSSVSSQLSSLLTQHINQQVSRIATENKIPELYLNDELWDLIKKDLRKKIQSAVAQPRSKRMVALMHVVEQHTGQSYSHKMLASHLGFKPVSTYLMNSAETNASSVKVAKPSLLSQASVRQQSSEIKINLNNSSIVSDIGGAGSNNGVIDAGEWVKLELSLQNASKKRWYSTSGWVSVEHPCAWSPTGMETELPELPPGTETKVKLSVFLSESCANNAKVPVKFRIEDTHRTDSNAKLSIVELSVRKKTQMKLNNIIVDRDIPGLSDGTNRKYLEPDALVELSTGLYAGLGSISAQTMYGLSPRVQKLFDHKSFDGRKMDSQSRDNFAASDDLDLRVTQYNYQNIADDIAKKWKWRNSDDAQILIAVDFAVETESPDALSLSEINKMELIEPPPLTADELVELFPKYVQLMPRYTSAGKNAPIVIKEITKTQKFVKNQDGEVVEASEDVVEKYRSSVPKLLSSADGYQVSFDEEGFRDTLAKRLTVERNITTERVKNTVAYVHRAYIVVPLKWAPILREICFDGLDNDNDGNIDCRDSDCALIDNCKPKPTPKPKPKPKKPDPEPQGPKWLAGLDVGTSVRGTTSYNTDNFKWNVPVTITNLLIRPNLAFGKARKGVHPIVLYLQAESTVSSEDELTKQSISLNNFWTGGISTSFLGAGVAYRLPFTPWLIAEPQIFLGSNNLDFSASTIGSGSGSTTFQQAERFTVLRPGITMRVSFLASQRLKFSAFIDIDANLNLNREFAPNFPQDSWDGKAVSLNTLVTSAGLGVHF